MRVRMRCLTFLWLLLSAAAGIALAAEDAGMGVERVARLTSPGYQAATASDNEVRWVQVDLGKACRIDAVKLLPLIDWSAHSQGFPARFRIAVSSDPQFATATPIADRTDADYPDPGDAVGVFHTLGAMGRYVRLTVTRLRNRQFSLAKLEVWSGGKDVAQGCPAADALRGDLGKTPL